MVGLSLRLSIRTPLLLLLLVESDKVLCGITKRTCFIIFSSRSEAKGGRGRKKRDWNIGQDLAAHDLGLSVLLLARSRLHIRALPSDSRTSASLLVARIMFSSRSSSAILPESAASCEARVFHRCCLQQKNKKTMERKAIE